MEPVSTSIQVNFSRPFPVFPLDGVVLLPHALLRLFVFEPRYRQMVERVLDGNGQIAMAVFEGETWRTQYHGNPPVRQAVCVGQIVQHERLADGNFRVLLQGVCRARIKEEQAPTEERLYRAAILEPLDRAQPSEDDLFMLRDSVMGLMRTGGLSELATVRAVLREVDTREIPTRALLEVVTLSVLNEKRVQYRLLAEGDTLRRGEIIERELSRLRGLVEGARRQFDENAPSGVSWN